MDPLPAAVAAVAIMIFAIGGLYVYDATVQDSRHDITIDNESFTPNASDGVERFDNSELERADYDETVDVFDANESEIEQSGNYTWHDSNGTLSVVSNSQLDNESNATITYGYLGQTLDQTKVSNVLIDSQELVRVLIIVAGAMMLLTALVAMGVLT